MKKLQAKAIALMSGGLDSTLAAKLVRDQDIDVIGLHLASPFGCRNEVKESAEALGIPLVIKEKGEAYLDLVKDPVYGYGKNMNPCIDCRIYMFQLADVVRQKLKADFIVTGEVLGQRPMSQQRNSMNLIDKKSSLDNILLRPLSGKLFPPTKPELEGWIDRSQLLSISGRGRTRQLELAKQWGITAFESPGGGCLLTETSFSGRLRDFFEHDGDLPTEQRLAQSALLRFGRHFRVSDKTKLIVGRNEQENEQMTQLWKQAGGIFYDPINFSGPVAVALGVVGESEQKLVGRLITRYGKSRKNEPMEILFQTTKSEGTFVADEPITETELSAIRL